MKKLRNYEAPTAELLPVAEEDLLTFSAGFEGDPDDLRLGIE